MATDADIASWIDRGVITPEIARAIRKERRVRRMWSAAMATVALLIMMTLVVMTLWLDLEVWVVGGAGGHIAYYLWKALDRRVHRWRFRDVDVSFSVKIYTDGLRSRDVQ